ncbi:MAG: diguanylate cyclase [Massilia sp.]|nr:diguanylate cyclase [Massilia sp.]
MARRTLPMVLVLIFALCLGIGWKLWRAEAREEARQRHARFESGARQAASELSLRIATYVQLLRGVQGLFNSSADVTRDEFSSFLQAQVVAESFPGMQGVGYLAAAPRDKARPVIYFEPFGTLPPVTDPARWREPARRATLECARDSGQAEMSPRVTLGEAEGANSATGAVLVLAVYRQGAPKATIDERRAALDGWVFAPIHTDILTRMLERGLEREPDGRFTLSLFDGDSSAGAAALSAGSTGNEGKQRTLQLISVAGHRWTLAVDGEDSESGLPSLALAGVVTASAFLGLLAWMLARSSAAASTALDQARLLTLELESGNKRMAAAVNNAERAQAMLRSVLDSTIDGILVDNGNGRLLMSNQRFRELWSVPASLGLAGSDEALIAHIEDQLLYPAPFRYSRQLGIGAADEYRELLRLKDGRFFEQFTRAHILGAERARLWTFRDITERKQIEQRERSHRHVLELLARGAPLNTVLEAVVLGIEATNPGMICTVLLLDADGERLLTGAAPSMPQFFNDAIHGVRIGEGVGSCGTSAAMGARVVAEDIATHPYWHDYKELAARAGVASCWSQPIRGGSGRILGTFAIYHRTPTYPSPAHVVLIEQAAQLAGIGIEQAQAALALRAGEERFRSLYLNAPVALWQQDWSALQQALSLIEVDADTGLESWLRAHPHEVARLAALVRITDANGAALAQVGASAGDMGALGLGQNFDHSAHECLIDAIVALNRGDYLFTCESRFVRLDGMVRQNHLTLLVMPGHAHSLDFIIVSTLDITERKRIDAELLTLATTDFLTALPNRREFMGRLDDQFERLQRKVDGAAAVLMLDIDHFKRINDEHGHAAGDAVLYHLADLMRACQRRIDTLGRVGGEEFAVLLPGARLDDAAAYAERLRASVQSTPLMYHGKALQITVSIGIAALEAADQSAGPALIRADQALYRAKAAGRNRVGLPEAQ